ncbi:hypothetical protein NXS98_05780 [Fontisphaera persica]|uniref:hypothetical protein n=1 Tax=Fontisphaera persica TaxID=2974023 RepID=UPI0024C0A02E|nr:hypothetical protein [Fontisphaera persica]WCJ60637.1 hypothetical protein NXS98_05780 [Fontisphaera persica]
MFWVLLAQGRGLTKNPRPTGPWVLVEKRCSLASTSAHGAADYGDYQQMHLSKHTHTNIRKIRLSHPRVKGKFQDFETMGACLVTRSNLLSPTRWTTASQQAKNQNAGMRFAIANGGMLF